MPRQPYPARRTRALSAAVFAALPLVLPATQSAAFTPYRTWIGSSGGSWALANNWSPNGIPGSSESLTITGTTSNYTVNYNGSYTTLGPANIIMDASSAANSLTFNFIVTNNLYSSSEAVGYSAGHVTLTQQFGTNTMGGNLNIGYNAGATGTYSLSGTGQVFANEEGVGTYGSGTFIQTGGTHTVTSTVDLYGTFHIGAFAGSSGQYTLSAGKFVAQNLNVGDAGAGTFTQTGGAATVTTAFCVGLQAGSTGSYSLSGAGSLTASSTISLGGSTTAAGGIGSLTISGGTAKFTGAANVWPGSRLTLNGGTLSAPSLSLTGANQFDLSGGTFTVPLATQPAAAFRQNLFAGRIFSTAATADPQHRLAVGYTTSAPPSPPDSPTSATPTSTAKSPPTTSPASTAATPNNSPPGKTATSTTTDRLPLRTTSSSTASSPNKPAPSPPTCSPHANPSSAPPTSPTSSPPSRNHHPWLASSRHSSSPVVAVSNSVIPVTSRASSPDSRQPIDRLP